MLFLVSVVEVIGTAKRHQVFDHIFCFTSAHTPCFDMVYILGLGTAYLARDKVRSIVVEKVEVYFCMLLH